MTNNKFIYNKSSRLLKAVDFLYLKKDARFILSGNIILYYKTSRLQNSISRLGIAVSKKFGGAVLRNKFKRIARETFRYSDIKNAGLDILVTVNQKKNNNKDINFNFFNNLSSDIENAFSLINEKRIRK
jgi:ribonuclease P protein component